MTTSQPVLAMAPMDERPVNTRYPKMLAAIAGLDLHLPPDSILGRQRAPADRDALADWLRETARSGAEAVFVCAEMLGYGNLINSRISEDSAANVISRIALLEELGKSVPVHAFSVITRVANADDCVEEPLYWKEWGTRCYRYSRLAHLALLGKVLPGSDEAAEFRRLESQIPEAYRTDWLVRRLRNHTVNFAMLDMAARGTISSLRLTSDDTAEYGLPSRERDWISTWPDLIGRRLSEHIRMHPGADEVGSALVAWWLNSQQRAPRVWIDYTIDQDAAIVAPYEDRPISETVIGQLLSCGCVPATTPQESDYVLGVVTPSPRRTDYRLEFINDDRWERSEPYHQQILRLAKWQKAGKPVAIADVAYPNGADPLHAEILLGRESGLEPGALAAYGAWNTAGNTLGTVCAQASCFLAAGDNPERALAQRLFLAHRFLEDEGYQSVVRRAVRASAIVRWGRHDPNPGNDDEVAIVCAEVEQGLSRRLARLQASGIGVGLEIKAGSVRLPWRRTFEVDFELEDIAS